MKNTSAFVEVIYRDNLYGDRVTIDIGKLKKINKIQNSSFLYFDNDSNEEISSYYADLILNTGDYTIESKEKISINGKYNFSGYKVKIETKKNIIRTYMVLVDNNNDYLLFSQSTDKSEEDLIDILTEVGNGNGLLSYDEFYNVFFTIPYNIMNNDLFLGFTLSKLNNSYAESKNYEKWARLYVGHWAGQVYFRNFQKGNWSYGIYDTQTSSKNQRINSLYENSYNFEKVNVQNTYGNLVMERWDSKVSEINFVVDRYTCMINNTQYSRLSKNDLINRANLIQLNK